MLLLTPIREKITNKDGIVRKFLNKIDDISNDIKCIITEGNLDEQEEKARLKLLEFFEQMRLEGIDILQGTSLNGKSHKLLNKSVKLVKSNGLEHKGTDFKKYAKNRYFESVFRAGKENSKSNFFEITEIIESREQRLIQIGIRGKDKFAHLNLEIIFLIKKISGKDDIFSLINDPFKKFLESQFGGLEYVDNDGSLHITKKKIGGYEEHVHKRKYVFLYEDNENNSFVYIANKDDDDIHTYRKYNCKIHVV